MVRPRSEAKGPPRKTSREEGALRKISTTLSPEGRVVLEDVVPLDEVAVVVLVSEVRRHAVSRKGVKLRRSRFGAWARGEERAPGPKKRKRVGERARCVPGGERDAMNLASRPVEWHARISHVEYHARLAFHLHRSTKLHLRLSKLGNSDLSISQSKTTRMQR
jgi:hypothetical protein